MKSPRVATSEKPSLLRPSTVKIQRARVERGLSILEVVKGTGLDESGLYRLEAGRVPRISTVRKLADFYGCAIADLLEDAS